MFIFIHILIYANKITTNPNQPRNNVIKLLATTRRNLAYMLLISDCRVFGYTERSPAQFDLDPPAVNVLSKKNLSHGEVTSLNTVQQFR